MASAILHVLLRHLLPAGRIGDGSIGRL